MGEQTSEQALGMMVAALQADLALAIHTIAALRLCAHIIAPVELITESGALLDRLRRDHDDLAQVRNG